MDCIGSDVCFFCYLYVNDLISFSSAVVPHMSVLFDAPDAQHLCMDRPIPASRYGIDIFQPDFDHCPNALAKTNPLFASVGPGDILYVPGTTIHAARNMEDGIGIGQNFHTVADYVSLMESGPMGYDATQARIHNNEKGTGVQVDPDFFALRDMFLLLKETDYNSDYWSEGPLYLGADESRTIAYERVLDHLQRALEKEPKLATRIAFLSGNRFAVLAMKAAGVWDCLDVKEREFVFIKAHGSKIKDETRERIHATFKRFGHTDGSCPRVLQEYLNAIEKGLASAGQAVWEEKTLSSFPSSWSKPTRFFE
jgi:hypothetical protein